MCAYLCVCGYVCVGPVSHSPVRQIVVEVCTPCLLLSSWVMHRIAWHRISTTATATATATPTAAAAASLPVESINSVTTSLGLAAAAAATRRDATRRDVTRRDPSNGCICRMTLYTVGHCQQHG